MRDDMARKVVERPRWGPRPRLKRRKLHQLQVRNPDETLRREPMGLGGTKELSENLAPLIRYLRSQVGRPWDDVYSEISAHLRPTNAVQQHVRDHLSDFVVVHTWLEDGVEMGWRWRGTEDLSEPTWWGPRFYVAPGSGLLRECRHKRRRPPSLKPDPDVRWDGPWRQLRRIGAVWYAFRLAPIPEDPRRRAELRDRVLRRTLEELVSTKRTDDPLVEAYGRPGVFAVEKRQLSKRELRQLDALPSRRGKQNKKR